MWRILVVDDNFANRSLLIDLLREYADCTPAVNGRQAFEAYKQSLEQDKPFDLILLDIAMPEVDGLQFLSMVREVEGKAGVSKGKGIPVIIVTAFEQPFLHALNCGCDDYMLKPVDPNKLLGKIKQLIGPR